MGVAFRQNSRHALAKPMPPSLRWPDEPDAVRKVVRVALVRCRGEPAIIAPGEKYLGLYWRLPER